MSVIISELTVRSFEIDKLTIQWRVQFTSPEDSSKIKYYVERSFSPTSEFEQLNVGPIIDQYFYVDTTVDLRQKYREVYYRLKVVNENAIPIDILYSDVHTRTPNILTSVSLIPLEIARNIRIYIEGTVNHRSPIGTPCLLFIRRTFGPYCPNCYDYLKERVRLSSCDVCYGTGYEKGFFSPIPVYLSFPAFTKTTTLEDIGEHQLTYNKIEASNWPIYSPGDLIVTRNNKRLRVTEVAPSESVEGILINQTLTALYITPGDTEYNIPINIGAFNG